MTYLKLYRYTTTASRPNRNGAGRRRRRLNPGWVPETYTARRGRALMHFVEMHMADRKARVGSSLRAPIESIRNRSDRRITRVALGAYDVKGRGLVVNLHNNRPRKPGVNGAHLPRQFGAEVQNSCPSRTR